MDESFDKKALRILRRSQGRKNNGAAYIYVSPFWLTSDMGEDCIVEIPAFFEFSKLSGKISFCGIDADISIFRRDFESGWSIECQIASGEKFSYGGGFLTDEDAFESFVRAVSEGDYHALCEKG